MCFALGACARAAPVGSPTDAHVVGTCSTIETGDEMVSSSDVSPVVSCNGPHVYETYAVITAPASIASLRDRPQPELLGATARNLCPLAPIRPYLGAGMLDSQWGISIWTKFPTPTEWRHGVRAVVCDLVVDAPPGVVPLFNRPLRNIMAYSDSTQVRVCRVGNPLTYLTCDHPHIGEKTGTVTFTGPANTTAAQIGLRRGCTRNALAYLERDSLPPGFHMEYVAGDSPYADCWLTSDTGPVTGTMRAGLVTR